MLFRLRNMFTLVPTLGVSVLLAGCVSSSSGSGTSDTTMLITASQNAPLYLSSDNKSGTFLLELINKGSTTNFKYSVSSGASLVSTDSCANIAKGGDCTLLVSVQDAGSYLLTITDNKDNKQIIPLMAYINTQPEVVVSTTASDAVAVVLPTSQYVNVKGVNGNSAITYIIPTLVNNSDSTLTLADPVISADSLPVGVTVDRGSCTNSLAAGDSCQMQVRIDSGSYNLLPFSLDLSVESNYFTTRGGQVISLSAHPDLVVSSLISPYNKGVVGGNLLIATGDVAIDLSANPSTVTSTSGVIVNNGESATSVTLSSSPVIGDIEYTPSNCNNNLAAGASCNYKIVKGSATLPSSYGIGSINAVGSNSSNNRAQQMFTYTVTQASDATINPVLTSSINSLNFNQASGTTESVVITLTNNSTLIESAADGSLTIGTINAPAADGAMTYSISNDSCSAQVLAIGSSCSYTLNVKASNVEVVTVATADYPVNYTYNNGTNASSISISISASAVPSSANLSVSTAQTGAWDNLLIGGTTSAVSFMINNFGTTMANNIQLANLPSFISSNLATVCPSIAAGESCSVTLTADPSQVTQATSGNLSSVSLSYISGAASSVVTQKFITSYGYDISATSLSSALIMSGCSQPTDGSGVNNSVCNTNPTTLGSTTGAANLRLIVKLVNNSSTTLNSIVTPSALGQAGAWVKDTTQGDCNTLANGASCKIVYKLATPEIADQNNYDITSLSYVVHFTLSGTVTDQSKTYSLGNVSVNSYTPTFGISPVVTEESVTKYRLESYTINNYYLATGLVQNYALSGDATQAVNPSCSVVGNATGSTTCPAVSFSIANAKLADQYKLNITGLVADVESFTTQVLWEWVTGSSSLNQYGTYGIKGVASTTNIPGSRTYSLVWYESNHIWLFGGQGYAATTNGYLNDLWKYDILTGIWTWMSGFSESGQFGEYRTKGIENGANTPGARSYSTSWYDGQGNLWLFGGSGYSSATMGSLNDLWRYNIASGNWAWMSGSTNLVAQSGVYGAQYTSSSPMLTCQV